MAELSKRHIARLRGMLANLDEKERRAQERFGDRVKGSVRSSDWRDAEALRAALTALTAGVPACGLPSDHVNAAGILGGDMPATVVRKLDAAARAAGVLGNEGGQGNG